MKPLVYIAGPYSSDPVHNTRRAVDLGIGLRETYNVAVIIPHVTLLADMVCPRPVSFWYQFDLDQLDHCDAIVMMDDWEDSTGAVKERMHAIEQGIPWFLDGDQASMRAFREWRLHWTS